MASLNTLYKTSFHNVVFVPYYGNKLRNLFFIISQTSVLLKKSQTKLSQILLMKLQVSGLVRSRSTEN